MLSKRLKQIFPLLNAFTGDYSDIARNINALNFCRKTKQAVGVSLFPQRMAAGVVLTAGF